MSSAFSSRSELKSETTADEIDPDVEVDVAPGLLTKGSGTGAAVVETTSPPTGGMVVVSSKGRTNSKE